MKHFVCWRPDFVSEVINIDADHVPDPIFWAVDTEIPIYSKAGETGPLRERTTADIINDLLDPKWNHFQLAVLGPAGAGKSHLIHRMRQEIERRPGLEVIPIRRLETNLRAVLEKLITRLSADDQVRFLDDLRRAGPALSTPAVQKSTLLDSLAQAIQEDSVRAGSSLDPDLEAELLRTLPNLLRDPYLHSAKFLRDGEVVPELVDRLFSSREGKRLEEEVLFEEANLPLSGIDLLSCSAPAREAIDVFTFNSDTTVPASLEVINRNLGSAITRALNFSGDQLGNLLSRIRERLKVEGKELVILFEEFARLQGYDLAMLAALIVQGDDKLCSVRWALACTTGRFRALPDTVRSRMDLVVDMESVPTRPDLRVFAGRYLNAVRLGADRLTTEFSANARKLSNACDGCLVRSDCFNAFDTIGPADNLIGLYPFTASALSTMARRSGSADEETFNPREFQKQVLKPTLIDEAPDLAGDRFPTARLLARMGGPSITNIERGRLQERAGGNFDRYLAYFQLWNEGRFSDASPNVLRAFGLEPLKGLEGSGSQLRPPAARGLAPSGPKAPPPPSPGPTPGGLNNDDANLISKWVDNGQLNQNLAQRLRQALFPLIERAIDWDALGLSQAVFSGATGTRSFRNLSIQFLRQGTTGIASPPIVFELPLNRDAISFSATALGLESLLMFDKFQDWGQANGLVGLAAVQELVAACADEVGRQLKALRGDTSWDPIAGAAELLIIGAALGGVISPNQTTDEKLLEAMFTAMPPECPYANGRLRTLYDRLLQRRLVLQNLVRAHVSASKGGRVGRSIDPRPLREAARRLRRDKWNPARTPQPRSDVYAEAGTLYEQVKRDLGPTLAEERAGRSEWLTSVAEAFGGKGKQDVLTAVRAAINAATASGVPVSSRFLEEAQQTFSGVQFDAAVRAVRLIDGAEPPQSELLHFARGRADAVDAASKLIKVWNDFLVSAEADIARKREDAGLEELSQKVGRATAAIDGLNDALEALGGAA